MAMAGATSTITLAGTLVTHNAEVLAGIVLSQLTCKGARVLYGSSTTIMDLRFTTAAVGSPELAMINAGVKIPQYIVEEAIRSAPSTVYLAARDPKNDFVLEGKRLYCRKTEAFLHLPESPFTRRTCSACASLLGLLPPVPWDKIKSVGNAAGMGALQVLLSLDAREEAQSIAAGVKNIELSGRADFQAAFVDALGF